MQVLDVRADNPKQVESATQLSADLGVANRHLVVLSGIALIDWMYDSDATFRGETLVRLGVHVSSLEQASAFVGLASISNDESSFVFSADTATVRLDPDSGELLLHINTALMGEWSFLGRISYQIVATVVRIAPHIGGKITWHKSLFTPRSLDPSLLTGMLTIVARRTEIVNIPGSAFPFEKYTPLTPGQVFRLEKHGDDFVAHYRVDNPVMAVTLDVDVKHGQGWNYAAGATLSVQHIAGSMPFTLTGSFPFVDGVDFRVAVVGYVG